MTTISQNKDSTKGIWVEGGCKESVLNNKKRLQKSFGGYRGCKQKRQT